MLQRFFKTAPGQYGAGDRFVGLRVPEIRKLATVYRALPLSEVITLRQPYLQGEIPGSNMNADSRPRTEGRG